MYVIGRADTHSVLPRKPAMQRTCATNLFAHMKKPYRATEDAETQETSASERNTAKERAGTPAKKAQVGPPGQLSITSFFQKPKRDREEDLVDRVDLSECSTVVCEKRRKIDDGDENKPLPRSFSQWDKAWDEGTSGLEWNKTAGVATTEQPPEGARTCVERADSQLIRETPEAGVSAEKCFLMRLDDEWKTDNASSVPEQSVKPSTQDAAHKPFALSAFTATLKPRSSTLPSNILTEESRSQNPPVPKEVPTSGEGKVPPEYRDAWDDQHVRLPCSPRNVSLALSSPTPRWDTIRKSLWPPSKLEDFSSLRRAILSYMSGASAMRKGGAGQQGKWSFDNLRLVLEEDMSSMERRTFFWSTLPHMVKLALALPAVCGTPIPLLRAGSARSVNLTALQCASLLANAFFCTFPAAAAREQSGRFPSFNFVGLFEADEGVDRSPKAHEKRSKLRCLLHYFDRQAARLEAGGDGESYGQALTEQTVTFTRRVLREGVRWEGSGATFDGVRLRVRPEGTIEDHDESGRTWQADFANCVIGGGVLGRGAVQEEIRFLLSPELIVSRLLTEELRPKESVLIVGSERFCNYKGYASSFRFAGDHVDKAEVDASGQRVTAVTAMDAIMFYRKEYLHQFRPESLRRELDKAFVSFSAVGDHRLQRAEGSSGHAATAGAVRPAAGAIASGNWGCGVFGGDAYLKGIIQMMAAAEAGRGLVYLSFGDHKLTLQLEETFRLFVVSSRTVGEVWKALEEFRPHPESRGPSGAGQELRRFLLSRFRGSEGDRDYRASTP